VTRTTFKPFEPDDRGAFDAEQWRALGITKQDGLIWWRHRIGPAEALRWRRAGVTEPIDAVRWQIAGVTPDTVREWRYAKIDAREAVSWAELGFDIVQARRHKRLGRTAVQALGVQALGHGQQTAPPAAPPSGPSGRSGPRPWSTVHPAGAPGPHRFMDAVRHRHPRVVHSYLHRQWFDEEATAWAARGIDAAEAIAWKELGLTPAEAERQQAQGLTAMQAAKAWWQAGIPFGEVADWIGAGLSPSEAAQQRANGVTAERAAVLRSLQRDQ
jgi:hypothetical protein